jgi:hypothetical protein
MKDLYFSSLFLGLGAWHPKKSLVSISNKKGVLWGKKQEVLRFDALEQRRKEEKIENNRLVLQHFLLFQV